MVMSMKLYKIIYWVLCAEGFKFMGTYTEFSHKIEVKFKAKSKPDAVRKINNLERGQTVHIERIEYVSN